MKIIYFARWDEFLRGLRIAMEHGSVHCLASGVMIITDEQADILYTNELCFVLGNAYDWLAEEKIRLLTEVME